MNLLIFGGLLVVGLLAILGIVWAIRSEPTARRDAPVPSTPAAAAPTVSLSLEKNTAPPQTRGVTVNPVTVTQTPPGTREVEQPITEEPLPLSNGQLHELMTQLQTLHQQSQEFERRLSILTNMVEHIQRSQNGRLSIDEFEGLDTTEVPSTR